MLPNKSNYVWKHASDTTAISLSLVPFRCTYTYHLQYLQQINLLRANYLISVKAASWEKTSGMSVILWSFNFFGLSWPPLPLQSLHIELATRIITNAMAASWRYLILLPYEWLLPRPLQLRLLTGWLTHITTKLIFSVSW